MRYENTIHARFIDRPNRFIADVDINGRIETVHVKNTGRCRELLIPNAKVTLAKSDSETRKTRYDLISVYKENVGWINIYSQAPNAVVKEWLDACPEMFSGITLIKPEYTYGSSRVDFYAECGERRIFIEVKGCTLEIGGVGYFPDAPTERGVKHLNELAKAVNDGYECYIAFVIAVPGVTEVFPNITMHREFGEALDKAEKSGVKVLYLPCHVAPDELRITEPILKK